MEQDDVIPTKFFLKKASEISDDEDDSDLEEEQVSLFVKKTVKEKSQISASKTLTNEQISELYSKLGELSKTKSKREKERLSIEERKRKRDNKSFQIISSCLQKILSHAAFIIRTKSSKISKLRLSYTAFGNTQVEKESTTNTNKSFHIKKKIEFISSIDIIKQVIMPDFSYHQRALFFWSAFLQNYVSLLKPVKLVEFKIDHSQ